VSLFSCIPHPFVCLQVGVCYLSRAFSGVVGLASSWLSDAFNFVVVVSGLFLGYFWVVTVLLQERYQPNGQPRKVFRHINEEMFLQLIYGAWNSVSPLSTNYNMF
jgi:hypothetical protein